MIGIEATYISSYEKLIYTLLNGIDFKKYDFYVVEDEIIVEGGNKKLPDKIVGDEFLDYFSKDNYFVYFMNLQIYNKGVEAFGIDDYNEFLKSDCQFILLITDNRYIECYFKEESIKDVFLKNLDANNISYEIKTVENDGRCAMNLF